MVINKDPQKESSNGEETPQERKKRELLATGRFEEGDQGELIRKKTIREQLPVGLPSKERIRELETLDRPMTEVEAREYALASFDPSSNMNIMFSLAAGAGFDPVGDAAMKVLKGGYNVLKGGVGTAKKAIGEGVRAMKSLPDNIDDLPYEEMIKMPVVYDPESAIMAGREFTERFYTDPYVQKHFTDLYGSYDVGQGALPKTFQRGSSPAPVQSNPMRGEYEGAAGVFDPNTDEVFIDEYFFNPRLRDQRNPAMGERVKNIVSHELGHYSDAPMFEYPSVASGAGLKMADNLGKSIVSDMPNQFVSDIGPLAAQATRNPSVSNAAQKYWNYITEPEEITANAQEMRRLMEDFIFNKNTDQSLFKSIGDDESFTKLMLGDFSELSDKEAKILFENVYENSGQHLRNIIDYVFKGGAGNKLWGTGKFNEEKIKSISDVLKYALMVPAAGVAATQVEMIDGGKLKLLKKK
jgi:hypothetical protein